MKEPIKVILDNGLTIILQETHNAPVVSMNLCCKVGSRYEGPKERGICHLIEHMIFKGTPTYPVGEIARQVEASGGDINAYTGFDETVLFINMASDFMTEGLDILADAALNPLFDADELACEKEVIVEEISRSEDSPMRQLSEDLFKISFTRHPYGKPIAGSRETVRAITRAELLNFYKKWYVGPNLIFVMAGNFEAKKILPRLKKIYGNFPSASAPRIKIPQEPKQRRPRVTTRAMEIKGSYLGMSFHTPALVHPDVPAIDILAHILSGAESSRLDRRIKDEQGLVRSIESTCYSPEEPCLFIIDAELSRGKPKQVIQSIFKEIQKLHTDLVSPSEIMRAKINLRSTQVYERETVEGLCRKLGFFEITTGDYRFEEKYYAAIEEVTPENIQNVAHHYLTAETLNIALCHPRAETSTVKAKELAPPIHKIKKPPRKDVARRNGDTHCFPLPNGIRLIVKENHIVPLVSVRSASLGGIRFETLKNNGISNLIAETLTKGTKHRSALEIASQMESMAGSISGYAGRNLFGLKTTFLSDKLDEGIDLFCDVLVNPTFDGAEVKKEKRHILSAIRDQNDHPSWIAMKEFVKNLFPNHPYQMTLLGTASTVRSLKSKKLISTYRKWMKPNNLVISVVGNVQAEHIREVVSERLETLSNKTHLPRLKSQKSLDKRVHLTLRKKGKQQAHIIMGFLGATLGGEDRFGLDVLNAVLAGQGGRLFINLRDRQGLCYTVNTSLYEGLERGFFAVYMGTDPQKLDTALLGIERELEQVVKKAISHNELERAKRYLIGTFALDLQRNSSVSAMLAYDEIYGLGYDDYLKYTSKIKKITRDQVQTLAKKYIRLDRAVTVVVRP